METYLYKITEFLYVWTPETTDIADRYKPFSENQIFALKCLDFKKIVLAN